MIRKAFLLSVLLLIIPSVFGMDANQSPTVQSSLYSSSSLAAAAVASTASIPEAPTSAISSSSSSKKRLIEEYAVGDGSIHVDKHSRTIVERLEQPRHETQRLIVPLMVSKIHSENPLPKPRKSTERGLKRSPEPDIALKDRCDDQTINDDNNLLTDLLNANMLPLYEGLQTPSSGGSKRSKDTHPESYIDSARSESLETLTKRICIDFSLKTNDSLSQSNGDGSCSLYSILQNPHASLNDGDRSKRQLDTHPTTSVDDITSKLETLDLDSDLGAKKRRTLLPLENEEFLLSQIPFKLTPTKVSSGKEMKEESRSTKLRCLAPISGANVYFLPDTLPLLKDIEYRLASDELCLSSIHTLKHVDQWLDQRQKTKLSSSQPTNRLILVYRSLNADALRCQEVMEELKVLDNPVALVHAHEVLERTSQLWHMYCTKFYKTSEKIVPLNLDIFQMTTMLNDLKTKKMLLKNCNDINMKVLLSAYILDSCDLLRVAAEMAGDQNQTEYVNAQITLIKAP